MYKILSLFVLLGIGNNELYTQNCKANFEADAGPDIDVCEGGSVNLNGIIGGDANKAVWRGGKGTFNPNRNALQVEYTPDSSEIDHSVVLTLVASNPDFSDCIPGRDAITITVNSQPVLEAGVNTIICPGQSVELSGKLISGKAEKYIWKTAGTGTFSDNKNLNTTYFPSEADIQAGGCAVKLIAKPFGVCMSDSDALSISIVQPVNVTVPELIDYTGNGPIKIKVTADNSVENVHWESTGTGSFNKSNTLENAYTPSDKDLLMKIINISISLTRVDADCETTKVISVNMNHN